ncbi:hypothetical protein QE152_g21603 [Popillia japonica]|uniref:Uncharacterized protein n=1 Tax=Popillia japonica TaxID=7064 RepID=A0AAW1KNZ5_POPJA
MKFAIVAIAVILAVAQGCQSANCGCAPTYYYAPAPCCAPAPSVDEKYHFTVSKTKQCDACCAAPASYCSAPAPCCSAPAPCCSAPAPCVMLAVPPQLLTALPQHLAALLQHLAQHLAALLQHLAALLCPSTLCRSSCLLLLCSM